MHTVYHFDGQGKVVGLASITEAGECMHAALAALAL